MRYTFNIYGTITVWANSKDEAEEKMLKEYPEIEELNMDYDVEYVEDNEGNEVV